MQVYNNGSGLQLVKFDLVRGGQDKNAILMKLNFSAVALFS